MALAQTDLPELKRFTFFVSRRFEEGRERFRLHMGYFATLAEAEEWLGIVRDIYPGAWAGEAPGRKLRERAAAAQAEQAQHAAGPQPQIHAVVRASVPRAAEPPPPLHVPVVHAAPPRARAAAPVVRAPLAAPAAARPAAPAARPAAAPARNAAPAPAAAAARAVQPPRPMMAPHTSLPKSPPPKASPPKAPPPKAPVAAVARPAAAPAAQRPALPPRSAIAPAQARAGTAGAKPVFQDSNVREVLKALGDASATGETRLMRSPPAPRPPPAASSSLSDTQVLKMLETRRPEGGEDVSSAAIADASQGGIPLLKPDDTGTRQALKDAVTSNAPVAFAVQLQWSVQPAELDKVPPLAIFSAYTLYTVEGSREGRKWYGLRLGFFSDAISAKQVAYYVRSEFTSVAVVPVSPQEKARATDQDKRVATLAAPAAPRSPDDEFPLIDDSPAAPAPARAAAAPAKAAAKPMPKVAVGRTVRPPPGAPRPRPAGKVGARAKSGPQTLEETLEILGASELTIDSGSGETLNDSAVRHLRVEVQKNSPFSKLLERLSERIKKT